MFYISINDLNKDKGYVGVIQRYLLRIVLLTFFFFFNIMALMENVNIYTAYWGNPKRLLIA